MRCGGTSAAHHVEAQSGAPARLRNGDRSLGGTLHTAASRQIEQPYDMVAGGHVASGEHTRIGAHRSADARGLDRHSERHRRDAASACCHADCYGPCIGPLLAPRRGTGRRGQHEQRDQRDECRCDGSHGHSIIRDRCAGERGRVRSHGCWYFATRSGLLSARYSLASRRRVLTTRGCDFAGSRHEQPLGLEQQRLGLGVPFMSIRHSARLLVSTPTVGCFSPATLRSIVIA